MGDKNVSVNRSGSQNGGLTWQNLFSKKEVLGGTADFDLNDEVSL